jgi:hypothetical protein
LELHSGEKAAVFHYVLITKDISNPRPLVNIQQTGAD